MNTCKDTLSRRDYRKLKTKLRPVVMWDGEGITVGNTHGYLMLCNSNGNYIESDFQLDTVDIFNFLIQQRGSKDTLHIGFAVGYDVAMWLRPLSEARRIMLYGGRVVNGKQFIAGIYRNATRQAITFYLGGHWWSISYRPRKQFQLRRFARGERPSKFTSNAIQREHADTFTLWDVWGFYQSTFVVALEKNNIVCDVGAIADMKGKRNAFTSEDRDSVRAYCFSECRAGVQLYKQTLADCVEADIIPARHDGPGALAASLYKSQGVKAEILLEPERFRVPVATAYFGGRIELARLGRIKGLRGYDIASAYPAQIRFLPSLIGEWSEGKVDAPGARYLYRLRYAFKRGLPFYPLPYRTHTDSVVFSAEGDGWYWDCEHDAASTWCERFSQSPPEVVSVISFVPSSTRSPFTFVPEIFDRRAEWKRDGRGAEKVLKLALNSLYGKTAQQLGGSLDRLPPFFSLVWAGLITAGTRAALLTAACLAKDPYAVVAFMTDGLYVTEEIDMPVAKGVLGAWEPPEVYDDAVFVQAGVYWTQIAGKWKARYRGFDRETMQTPDIVLHAWAERKPLVEVPVTRFASFGAALMSNDLWEKRGTWVQSTRRLNTTGESVKREPNLDIYELEAVPLTVKINTSYLLANSCSKPYNAITLTDELLSDELQAVDVEEYNL